MTRATAVIWIGLATAAACSSGASGDSKPSARGSATAVVPSGPALPRVDEPGRVMMLTNAKPGALVLVDPSGKLELAPAGPAWNGDLAVKNRVAVQIHQLRQQVLAAMATVGGPVADAARVELDTGRRDAQVQRATNDPYDAQLARQQAIDQARAAGILGSTGGMIPGDPDVPSAGRLHGSRAMPIDGIAKTAPLVLPAPDAPASAIVDVVHRTGGVIGVSHAGKLAALSVGFEIGEDQHTRGASTWLEILLDDRGVHLIVQPDDQETIVPAAGGKIDLDTVRTGYRAIRNNANGRERNIDILVNPKMQAQQLVDLLVALEGADAHHVSLALGPLTREERHKGIETARKASGGIGVGGALTGTNRVAAGSLNAQGDLDKVTIRDTVKRQLPRIQDCYEQALTRNPSLQGTVQTQFFINPDGTVAVASVSGLDDQMEACVGTILKAIEFPKPKGGGGVQVNYPFSFRPTP